MAVIKRVIHSGNKFTSTLNGKVRLEEARNRIVTNDEVTGNELNVIDGQGSKTYDDSGSEIARSGRQPDGSYNTSVVTPGNSIEEAFA